MKEDLVTDRSGQVWVGTHLGQSVFLLLERDDLYIGEKYIALDLLTGKMSHLLTDRIETDLAWVMYS